MKLKPFTLLLVLFAGVANAGQMSRAVKVESPHTSSQRAEAQQTSYADAHDISVIVEAVRPKEVPRSVGSGVWVGKKGYVVTCWHVVAGSRDLRIGIARDAFVAEGNPNVSVTSAVYLFGAKLEAYDKDTDIAILKANTPPDEIYLPPVVQFAGFRNEPAVITPQIRNSPREGHCVLSGHTW